MKPRPTLLALFLLVTPLATPPASARNEWYRGLDLEAALARADLVILVRVGEIGESKTVHGGKAERTLQQFKFEPVRMLKGVFTRDVLLLTNDDLGYFSDDQGQMERGQLRLLMLGRSGFGYANANQSESLDHSLPPLRDENDPLRATAGVLIGVSQEHDRARKVALLLDGLRAAKGTGAVPLLVALQRRALLAAQTPGAVAAVSGHLADPAPPVREAAAHALQALLKADYLERPDLRQAALTALVAALQQRDADLPSRLAVLDALGATGTLALKNEAAAEQLKLDRPRLTFSEQIELLQVIGQQRPAAQRDAVLAFLERLPLDAPDYLQTTAGLALVRLDAEQALTTLMQRIKAKYAAGLDLQIEIGLLGELPATAAAPALLDVVKLALNYHEKIAFATVCMKVADPRLVPSLAALLDPRRADLRWRAVEALRKINTFEAAQALHPHLREEGDLLRKLQIAELLGRHGFHEGYPYAMEHLSEPHLLEQAVATLAAMREPKAVPALREILKTSNDTLWNGAAVRALGALGEKDLAPQFLEIVQDLKRPLAPPALIALGDLGEVKALPKVREGLASRNGRVVLASARAAAKLIPLSEAKTDDLRDQLAALFADADASQEVRFAALETLVTIKDTRLDRVLGAAERDAGLEGSGLLDRIEKLLRERKVKLAMP